jgi:hypothetical protein
MDPELERQSRLPVPTQPRRPPPPPPPPPPPRSSPPKINLDRRDIFLGIAATAGAALGVNFILSIGNTASEAEKQDIAYIASQMGIPTEPTPVRAVVSKKTGKIVAIAVDGPSGAGYLAKPDRVDSSRMMLMKKGDKSGRKYMLQTRLDRIDISNRRQIETIFRTAGWERALIRVQ